MGSWKLRVMGLTRVIITTWMLVRWVVFGKFMTYIFSAHRLAHHVRFAGESIVAGQLAQTLCAAVEDVCRAGFRK